MEHSCIIVANEPRAYREIIAAALGELLSDLQVVCVEPRDLDSAIAELSPRVVVCSRLAAIVEDLPIAWMVLYPEGTATAIGSMRGERTVHPRIDLTDVLDFVDRALQLAQMS